MSPQVSRPPSRRNPATGRRAAPPSAAKKAKPPHPQSDPQSDPSSPDNRGSDGGERTVKKLRLSKALTIPEGTTVSDACRRMAQRRVDAALLTDANGLLSGILTDKDIASRVVAEGLRPEQTLVSKIMTRNPIFVSSDTLAIDALHTMDQGKCRHLPIVENGEVTALLDITKCLYDAISRMEKASEQGSAIAAAVEGVERHRGNVYSAQHAFLETLRDRIFRPTLSTMITENTKVAVVSPSDPVCLATKKMREHRVNSVIIEAGGRPQGIFTSRDVLTRVVALNLSPELTLVEKVMTANPECATLETTILDALNLMHDRNFLHIPVIDHDGVVKACLDVLQITHAAISMVDGGRGTANDTESMMQKFWDSTLPNDHTEEECDIHSELSATMTSEVPESGRSMYPCLGLGNSFTFKFHDGKGRMHRCNCCSESLVDLVNSVRERLGSEVVQENTQLLYEDEDGDKVLLMKDSDLVGAVNHARSLGLKVLRLHLDTSDEKETSPSQPPPTTSQLLPQSTPPSPPNSTSLQSFGYTTKQAGLLAGTVSLASMGLMIYLKRSKE